MSTHGRRTTRLRTSPNTFVVTGLLLALSSCTEQEADRALEEIGEGLFILFFVISMVTVMGGLFLAGCIAIALSFVGKRSDGTLRPISAAVLNYGILLMLASVVFFSVVQAVEEFDSEFLVIPGLGMGFGLAFCVAWWVSKKRFGLQPGQEPEPIPARAKRTVAITVGSLIGAAILMNLCSGGSFSTTRPQPTSPPSPFARLYPGRPNASPNDLELPVGRAASVDGIEMRVVNSRIVRLKSFARDGGLFLVMHYRVSNGTAAKALVGGEPEWFIVSPPGSDVDVDPPISWDRPGWPFSLDVEAGEAADGWLALRLGRSKSVIPRGDYYAEWSTPSECFVDSPEPCEVVWRVLTSEEIDAFRDTRAP